MKNCIHFPRCGGCTSLNMPYIEQIAKKGSTIRELFGSECSSVLPLLPSPEEYYYRHKVQLPFGYTGSGRGGEPLLGCYAKESHLVVNQEMCLIQDEDCSQVAWTIRRWVKKVGLTIFNERTGNGFLRHVLLRRAYGTNEILVGLVTNGKQQAGTRQLSQVLLEMVKKDGMSSSTIVGIVQNVNTRHTNVVLGTEEIPWWGRAYLKEQLGDLKFKIGLSTFFQVNPFQTPNLYNEVLQHIPQGERVLDCYCGIGSIALWVAHRCSEVTGIEENHDSVRAARVAAKLNFISNASFIAGDVLAKVSELSLEGYQCVIVDPPRGGVQKEFCTILCNAAIKRVIYVSCNPESLKRDILLLKKVFITKSVRGVDMFPHTDHIECVAVLDRI